MALPLPLAIDAMGGDNAPKAIINGARLVLKDFPDLRFVFYGDEARIRPLVNKHRKLRAASEIVHTDHAISMHEKVSIALRKGRKSSMRLAINSVTEKKTCGVVSAGNTGALMATAKVVFKTLKGIERPAFAAFIPARKRRSVMLDMGANVDCNANHLLQFVIMGDAYARVVLKLDQPKIGLLNVGSEDMKGHTEVQTAHQILREREDSNLYYAGFVEGTDILEGTVDVVVTDGFTGNIALKTAEGTARLLYSSIKDALKSSLLAKIGLLLAKPALSKALRKFDPREHNGAILLGLNGIAVKSHGGADAKSFASAIKLAVNLIEQDINNKIIEELSQTAITGPLANPIHYEEPVVATKTVN
ncbi:MAG: phosphate acyltransferase [Rickettsiales bacterium]|nr:phosphate acyltransferase [Rickettsiales bacterium]